MDLCDYLMKYKQENNLSNYKLSKMLDLNEKTLRNILNRKTHPSVKTYYKIYKNTDENIKAIDNL